jgi:hypothetical protein
VKTIDLILYVLAGFCFLLAAIPAVPGRVNFTALGLFWWVLVPLLALAGP